MNKYDETLPVLNKDQVFVCEDGCGDCEAVEFDYCYSRSENLATGKVVELTHRAYKSSCCGAKINVWDESIEDIVQQK